MTTRCYVMRFETIKKDLTFSLREAFLKKPNIFSEYNAVSFVCFQATIKYLLLHVIFLWICLCLYILPCFRLTDFTKMNETPHFLTTRIAFHYITYNVSSRWYLTLISWSWTLSLLVFIVTYSDLHSHHIVQLVPPFLGNVADISYYRCSGEQFPLLMYIAIFHHKLTHFHTLTGHIYVKNVRQRVRLLFMVLCLLPLKYLIGHISLESISVCKNTLTIMKALFYYV